MRSDETETFRSDAPWGVGSVVGADEGVGDGVVVVGDAEGVGVGDAVVVPEGVADGVAAAETCDCVGDGEAEVLVVAAVAAVAPDKTRISDMRR